MAAGGSKNYKGKGLAIMSQKVEGPIFDHWPPSSTERLLHRVERDDSGKPVLTKEQIEHIRDVVEDFARRAFRRPPRREEIDAFVDLAKPAIEQGRDFMDAVRIPLRSILSSPQFLMFSGSGGRTGFLRAGGPSFLFFVEVVA